MTRKQLEQFLSQVKCNAFAVSWLLTLSSTPAEGLRIHRRTLAVGVRRTPEADRIHRRTLAEGARRTPEAGRIHRRTPAEEARRTPEAGRIHRRTPVEGARRTPEEDHRIRRIAEPCFRPAKKGRSDWTNLSQHFYLALSRHIKRVGARIYLEIGFEACIVHVHGLLLCMLLHLVLLKQNEGLFSLVWRLHGSLKRGW
jgi:hypothetical protein